MQNILSWKKFGCSSILALHDWNSCPVLRVLQNSHDAWTFKSCRREALSSSEAGHSTQKCCLSSICHVLRDLHILLGGQCIFHNAVLTYSGAVPLTCASRDLWKFTPTFCTVCFPIFQFELLKVEDEICFWKLRNEARATFEYLGWLLAKWLQKIGNVKWSVTMYTNMYIAIGNCVHTFLCFL